MRRVGREEAEGLVRRVRPDALVQQVRVATRRRDPDDPAVDAVGDHVSTVSEFEFADGGVYQWDWATPQGIVDGSQLWCSTPDANGDVVCVRAETMLPSPEVLRSRRGSVRLMRSRFTRPQPSIVDASVVAPADLTLGAGMTEDDALLVLRNRAAAERRRHKQTVGALFFPVIPAADIAGPLSGGLEATIAAGVLAAGFLPGLAGLVWYWGPAHRRFRRRTAAFAGETLDPVVVSEWRGFGVSVTTRDERRWSWSITPDQAVRVPEGTHAWATPVAEGVEVWLVGLRDGSGPPVVVRPDSPATEIRPPRSEIQDVIR